MNRNVRHTTLVAFLALLLFSATGQAQTAFEDASGDSSILIKDAGGFARINVTDKAVRIGYVLDISNSKLFYGFEVSGKLSGNVASLFNSATPSPEAKFRAIFGRKFLLSEKPRGEPTKGKLTDDWLTFQIGYARARYKLFDENAAFANQVRKQNFDGYSAIVSYNALFRNKRGPILLGISAGVERRNNIEDLDEIDVNDQVAASSSGTTQRTVVAQQKAFSGLYEETTAIPIKSDIVWFPKRFESQIAFNFFTRSNLGQGHRVVEPGVGLFFTKGKAGPTKVLGGISVSIRDGKGKVGLIAGFNF
jgi:hypothetical protein